MHKDEEEKKNERVVLVIEECVWEEAKWKFIQQVIQFQRIQDPNTTQDRECAGLLSTERRLISEQTNGVELAWNN